MADENTRAAWGVEVRAASEAARDLGGDLGRALELILRQAATFVEAGSDLGGGLMPLRFKSLAAAVHDQVAIAKAQRDAAIYAAANAHEAGDDLFRSGQATAARYSWKAEDGLRAAFDLKSPDAAPATSAPENKE